MGNFLPCLTHGARSMVPKATKQKLYCFDDPKRLLHRRKKDKRKGRITNTSAVSKHLSEEDCLEEEEEEEGEKGVIRVKVVLTKEEAARLLSMCMRGEEKTLAQLMSQIESRHTTAATHGSSHGGWTPVLESIPEEYC